jgi:hypothetical protein
VQNDRSQQIARFSWDFPNSVAPLLPIARLIRMDACCRQQLLTAWPEAPSSCRETFVHAIGTPHPRLHPPAQTTPSVRAARARNFREDKSNLLRDRSCFGDCTTTGSSVTSLHDLSRCLEEKKNAVSPTRSRDLCLARRRVEIRIVGRGKCDR